MLVFVIVAVFIAGLMVGRTPEYLGKKIQSFEVKMSMLVLLVLAMDILGFTAWACVSDWGKAGLNNNGPHGFSEMLYAYSSVTGNNGSAFAGLTASTYWYDTTLAIGMLIGRFLMIVPIMAIAGSLAAKKAGSAGPGIVSRLGRDVHVPADRNRASRGRAELPARPGLGPMVEHFLMLSGKLF
jgi:K+-transporting ATPase ATPase A chain